MADSYDAAQQALQDQQRAYLQAMADRGSAGAAAVGASIADAQSNKNAAVSAALAEAARRAAPPAELQSIEYQVGSPFDRQWEATKAADLSRRQSLDANTAAGDTVIQQALANIPALRAMSERQAKDQQFKLQQQQAQDALDMELKNVDLQIAQANRDKALSGSSGDPLVDQERQLNINKMQREADKANGETTQNVLDDAVQHLGGMGSNGFKALSGIIQSAGSLPEALSLLGSDSFTTKDGQTVSLKTPGGHPLDKDVLAYYLKRYEAAQ